MGCSGYDYPAWHGRFYPEDLPASRRLATYAETFDCVELNSTFHRLPSARAVRAWREQVPPGFQFAVKLSRYGTHMKHLADPGDWVERFTDRIRDLGDRLGPILVQLPPHWHADPERLRDFLEAAPDDLRWAVEVRDEDWTGEEVREQLRRAGAAMVIHDLLPGPPAEPPGDWMYARYHGPDPSQPYTGGYPHQRLAADARRFAGWMEAGRSLHAFFNNDADGFAPRDARRFRRYVAGALGD